MNNVKIAAALHALADAFLEPQVDPAPEQPPQPAETPPPTKRTRKAPPAPAPVEPVAPAPAPSLVEPTPDPAPAVKPEQINKLVLEVASESREAAVAVLKEFGANNTPELFKNVPKEKWQAVLDALEEAKAKLDAAKVQVATAESLI